MSDDIQIEFDEVGAETEAAVQIRIDGEDFWLPKSQCRIYEKSKKAYMPEWLAEDKGLI